MNHVHIILLGYSATACSSATWIKINAMYAHMHAFISATAHSAICMHVFTHLPLQCAYVHLLLVGLHASSLHLWCFIIF